MHKNDNTEWDLGRSVEYMQYLNLKMSWHSKIVPAKPEYNTMFRKELEKDGVFKCAIEKTSLFRTAQIKGCLLVWVAPWSLMSAKVNPWRYKTLTGPLL